MSVPRQLNILFMLFNLLRVNTYKAVLHLVRMPATPPPAEAAFFVGVQRRIRAVCDRGSSLRQANEQEKLQLFLEQHRDRTKARIIWGERMMCVYDAHSGRG